MGEGDDGRLQWARGLPDLNGGEGESGGGQEVLYSVGGKDGRLTIRDQAGQSALDLEKIPFVSLLRRSSCVETSPRIMTRNGYVRRS